MFICVPSVANPCFFLLGVRGVLGVLGGSILFPSGYNSGDMATRPTARPPEYDIIEPIGKRVVIRKDDNKRETKSGIVLPDSHEIPVITGRVIAISKAIENDEDHTIRQYDKVLFDPREAIPVELEHDNRLFVVSLDRVLAIFRRTTPKAEP